MQTMQSVKTAVFAPVQAHVASRRTRGSVARRLGNKSHQGTPIKMGRASPKITASGFQWFTPSAKSSTDSETDGLNGLEDMTAGGAWE